MGFYVDNSEASLDYVNFMESLRLYNGSETRQISIIKPCELKQIQYFYNFKLLLNLNICNLCYVSFGFYNIIYGFQ